MATRVSYGILVASLGAFGPRAQAFALEGPALDAAQELRRSEPGSVRVVEGEQAVALAGRGMGSSFFDFIPEAIKGIASVAKEVPAIEAASGMKSAQSYQAVLASLKELELKTKLVEAEGTASSTSLQAWAPWVAIGVGGLAMAAVVAYAVSKKFGRGPRANVRRLRNREARHFVSRRAA